MRRVSGLLVAFCFVALIGATCGGVAAGGPPRCIAKAGYAPWSGRLVLSYRDTTAVYTLGPGRGFYLDAAARPDQPLVVPLDQPRPLGQSSGQ